VLRAELPATLLGSVAALLALFEASGPWRWLAPLWLPWLLSVPIHWCVSSAGLGQLARRAGLLGTPSENEPEPLLQRIDALRALTRSNASARFRDLVLDPVLLAAHLSTLPDSGLPDSGLHDSRLPDSGLHDSRLPDSGNAAASKGLEMLRARALQEGPLSLSPAEWRRLAADRHSMEQLHREAWQHWPVESWDLGREEPQLPPEASEPRLPSAPAPSSRARAQRD
jgi:hypothetical protein